MRPYFGLTRTDGAVWNAARLTLGFLLVALLVPERGIPSTEPLKYQSVRVRVRGEDREARIPEGFVLEVLTEELDEPRMLTFGPNGDLFAGSKGDVVHRLPAPYTTPEVLVELRGYPHSVAFREGEILIARTRGLYRAPYRPGQSRVPPESVTQILPLPGGRGHSSRTVGVGPDGRVYVSLGIAGNCSDQYLGAGYSFENRRGGILVLTRDETTGKPGWKPFASGLRNPIGFDWHPGTRALYASNNGPDHWGYDLPPETFNKVTQGSFFGMPWFQWDGKRIRRDPCIDSDPPRPAADIPTPPATTFPARSAPMGVAFVPRGALVPALEGDAVVAIHGSWATKPTGSFFGDLATRRPPAVVVVRFEKGHARRVDELITGFQLPSGKRWARPVGVAVGPDGTLYFSSDEEAEALFRLRPKPRGG